MNQQISKMASIAVAMVSFANISWAAPETFADLVDEVAPAVVNITSQSTVESNPFANLQGNDMLPELFRHLFENSPQFQPQQRQATSLGSGYLISSDGFLVTNNHVIEGAETITVDLIDGTSLEAKLIGRDPATDVAVLKVDSDKELPFLTYGDSDEVRIGDWVLAIGNPLGQGGSVSAGIISQRNRSLSGNYDDYFQTDAAINQGNSGGPLLNTEGEVIGMNTVIISNNGGSIGLGFAMSSRVVAKVVEQIQEYGEARRGLLGVNIGDIDQVVADALGLDSTDGALVTNVPPGPALEAGVMPGDVIVSFDGNKIGSSNELIRLVGDAEAGKTFSLKIHRMGEKKPITLDVTLGRLDNGLADNDGDDNTQNETSEDTQNPTLGLTVTELTDEIRQRRDISATHGVLITKVDPNGNAAARGIMPNDVIIKVDNEEIKTFKDLDKAINNSIDAGRKASMFVIMRGEEQYFVAVQHSE